VHPRTFASVSTVVHIIPFDGIGGVEIAARSLPDGRYKGFDFRKCYLVSRGDAPAITAYRALNDPRMFLAASASIARMNPAVAVASLWRSCIVLLLLKMLRPQLRAITFLHSAVDAHAADWLFNRLAMWISREIWVDCRATVARVPKRLRKRVRVISFVTESEGLGQGAAAVPQFAYWGRLHPQKGLLRALSIFAKVRERYPEAGFHIIGPDDGALAAIRREVRARGIGGVSIDGPLSRVDIRAIASTCSFYLQPSELEGAAMSVIEAMQLGLVPVVTAVGEIPEYCRNGENSVIITTDEAAASKVCALLQEPSEFTAMACAAMNAWQGKPLYRDSVIDSAWGVLR
jgi:glycosyltransferase involved in cell wall biosynthesis